MKRSSKKNANLIIPYSSAKTENDVVEAAYLLSNLMPVIAMVTRMIAWSAFFSTIMTFMSIVPGENRPVASPTWLNILAAFFSLLLSYSDLLATDPVVASTSPDTTATLSNIISATNSI